MLLSGRDSDGDGEYPPYDFDDIAVLDGSSGHAFAIVNDQGHGNLEFAHFSATGGT